MQLDLTLEVKRIDIVKFKFIHLLVKCINFILCKLNLNITDKQKKLMRWGL